MSRVGDALSGIALGPSGDTRTELLRYTVVGGVAFLFDYGTLVGLTELAGVHYLASAAIAFGVGLVVNYLLSVKWVFARRKVGSRAIEFGTFMVIGLVGLGLNELAIWSQVDLIGLHYAAAKPISTILVYAWNFGARKFLLFR